MFEQRAPYNKDLDTPRPEPLRPGVFLKACDLPQAWAAQFQWRLLDTDFETGLRFIATWQAWKADAARPRLLHYVALTQGQVDTQAVLNAAAGLEGLTPLAQQLTLQAQGLHPGVHRLSFEGGRVLLTLCVGDATPLLKEQAFDADSVHVSASSTLTAHNLKTIARCCRRGTRLAFQAFPDKLLGDLKSCGFELLGETTSDGQIAQQALFNPRWDPKQPKRPTQTFQTPSDCIIIGAGLAGAACAASLARRGWRVTVLEAQAQPAQGASGLPVGMLAPHVSPDDGALSRLSRSGLRATWLQTSELLQAGKDWQQSGALQRRFESSGALPAAWDSVGEYWSRAALAHELAEAASSESFQDQEFEPLWHNQGGWVRPAALVQALLNQPGLIKCQYGAKVHCLEQVNAPHERKLWRALDQTGRLLAEADLVVVASAFESGQLLAQTTPSPQVMPLQAIRGQVSWGKRPAENAAQATGFPPVPVNGHGSFVPAFPTPQSDGIKPGLSWLIGATYQRDSLDLTPSATDHATNLDKLTRLLPEAAAAIQPAFEEKTVKDWVGVRCVSPDRLPLVGPVDADKLPGLWVCTALGSRGLTFSVLCGELLAAWLHTEPLPLEKRLAEGLRASRFNKTVSAADARLTSSLQRDDAP